MGQLNTFKNSVVAFLVGFIFAIGLGLSGMTKPEKVLGFLNLFGAWDPSLMFVMAGSIAVHFFAYKFIKNKTTPLMSAKWHVPTRQDLTPALIIGSLMFGAGWGLGGFCPGPALASIAGWNEQVLTFLISLVAGMYLYKFWPEKWKPRG